MYAATNNNVLPAASALQQTNYNNGGAIDGWLA